MSLDQAHSYNTARQCHLNERRTQFIIDRLKNHKLPMRSKVVEIGSGTGWLLIKLAAIFPQYEFIGIELNKDYVTYAKQQTLPANVQFKEGSAEHADKILLDNVDVILSNDVLHHIRPIMENVVRSISSKIDRKNNCLWLAIEPNFLNPYVSWFHWYWRKDGEDIFFPWEFLKPCKKHGWSLTRRGYLFLVPARFKKAPKWLASLERVFEWIPVLAGGVFLELVFPLENPRKD